MEEILRQVQQFAKEAHGSQRRKFIDEPYINHPVRVMQQCRQYNKGLPVAAAALLHDVLEDTAVTADVLRSFLNNIMSEADARQTMMLVKDLTDVYTHASFPSWNRRVRKTKESDRLANSHPDAQTIKYADIIDNSESIAGSGDDFAAKFLHECRTLLKKMKAGNPELYKKALETVNRAIDKLTDASANRTVQ